MEVELTPDQQTLVEAAVGSGRYRNAEGAVRDALLHWEAEERQRAHLLAMMDAADSDLTAGRFSDYSESTLSQLATEIKREGRSLHEERSAPRT